MPSGKTRRKIRAKLARKQHWRCYWCGGQLSKRTVTFDHKRCKSVGGEFSIKNGVASCQSCNADRGNTPFDVYRKQIAARKAAEVDTASMTCVDASPAPLGPS